MASVEEGTGKSPRSRKKTAAGIAYSKNLYENKVKGKIKTTNRFLNEFQESIQENPDIEASKIYIASAKGALDAALKYRRKLNGLGAPADYSSLDAEIDTVSRKFEEVLQDPNCPEFNEDEDDSSAGNTDKEDDEPQNSSVGSTVSAEESYSQQIASEIDKIPGINSLVDLLNKTLSEIKFLKGGKKVSTSNLTTGQVGNATRRITEPSHSVNTNLNPEATSYMPPIASPTPRPEEFYRPNVNSAHAAQPQIFEDTWAAPLYNASCQPLGGFTAPLALAVPAVYAGDPMEWKSWSQDFKKYVEDRTNDASLLLYHLKKFTVGDARREITALLNQDTLEAYNEAKRRLYMRFGRPENIDYAYWTRLKEWPQIKPDDGRALADFRQFMHECQDLCVSNPYFSRWMEDPDKILTITKKLPPSTARRWQVVYSDCQHGEDQENFRLTGKRFGYPALTRFCSFLDKEVRFAETPVFKHAFTEATRYDRGRKKDYAGNKRFRQARTFATESEEIQQGKSTDGQEYQGTAQQRGMQGGCPLCKYNHPLVSCWQFKRLDLRGRWDFLKDSKLCTGCLRPGHFKQTCPAPHTCKKCKKLHPTLLHNDAYDQGDKQGTDTAVSHYTKTNNRDACKSSNALQSPIVPVWVYHLSRPEKKKLVYALLDEQSDSCFITKYVVTDIKAIGTEVELAVSTMSGQHTFNSLKVSNLVVKGLNEVEEISLPKTYTRDVIPALRSGIPRPETAQEWEHLKGIAKKLMPYNEKIEIGILIGNNCIEAITPKEVITGKRHEPFAKRSALGWIAHEITNKDETATCLFAVETKTKELMTPKYVRQMFEQDFNDGKDEVTYSYNDKKFVRKITESAHKIENNHYEFPLPLKNDEVCFPNNREMVVKRLRGLQRKLEANGVFKEHYTNFMEKLIEKGYAEEVSKQVLSLKNGHVWYIPHHGVYHHKKPGKIRVVFDCSATYKGVSLNQHLLQGPDLTNNLAGVLARFRKEPIAFVCDIEAMYHQVFVNPEHRNLIRFLWWKDGNTEEPARDYKMTVHLFGATSSPSVANYALKLTANENEEEFGCAVANFIRQDFYVDDGLKSVSTVAEAVELIHKSKEICRRGGFNLHKFISNNKKVLSAIGPEECAGSIKTLDLSSESLPIEHTLGVEWCIESDHFQFRILLKDKPFTRRGILSTVSSVFDPLGMVSPVILTGKKILQELCRHNADWDDEVPEALRPRWERWRKELHSLQELKVPRCYKPENFGEPTSIELHHFADACEDGYGESSYLRLLNSKGKIHCSLVMSKSRVAPLKAITIPRLELTAAVVAVRVSNMLKKGLDYRDVTEVFWSDSMATLGYIRNEAKRFHVFVANRVQLIRDHTEPEQWKHVSSAANPADHASRGLSVQALINSTSWWFGPEFLRKPSENLQSTLNIEIKDSDPEVKKVIVNATQAQEFASLSERLEYFSDWHRAKKAVAACLKLQKKFKKGSNFSSSPVENIQEAEIAIIKCVQDKAFHIEKRKLGSLTYTTSTLNRDDARARNKSLRKTSLIYRLDPFIDSNGIIRVGGRIKSANLSETVKHPVILLKNSHITNLIICDCHQRVQHQGRGITMNELRASGFWVIGGTYVVSQHINNCVTCRKLRGTTQQQKMADLPSDRLEPAPPFTYCAVDFFGPFYIKEGRRELKRYGVIFTCMASRAVHLETANSLDTDSFLNAYRRFVGRRGPIRQLRSDRGSNFLGAKNEMEKCLREMDHKKIEENLLRNNCDWVKFKMNAPHASHMGGVWERQIRTVRSILATLFAHHGTQLDDESLRTFMVETESIINSRPLTLDNIASPQSIEPLTPNHLLTMKSNVILPPPGNFQRADQYSRRRWRRVQYLVNEFWHRWRTEFLQSLQVRNKWQKPKRNMQVNDVVILKDEDVPRNKWRLGKVTNAMPGADGLVRVVTVAVSDPLLDSHGKRTRELIQLDRPIHTLVLLLPSE